MATNETPLALAVQKPLIHLVARNPNEMALSQQCLADWLFTKIASCEDELKDLELIVDHARKSKWRTSGLDRQVALAKKRLNFYVKVKAASDAGYAIVPNFPADIFAIRVTRDNPNAGQASSQWPNPTVSDENPNCAPVGEGSYVAPEAKLESYTTKKQDDKGKEITTYHSYPVEFQDVEFPIACARPEVMGAVSEAMSKKIFDSFAVSPEGVMRKRKYDPIILGQVQLPKAGGYVEAKKVSFLIAWHLDLRTL